MSKRDKEIEELIKLLDSKTELGVSRINLQVSEEVEAGSSKTVHHHGRCDIGSPWAKGTVINYNTIDNDN